MRRVVYCVLLVLTFVSWASGSEHKARYTRIITHVKRTGLTATIPTATIFHPQAQRVLSDFRLYGNHETDSR
jgi:hypothetical protein